MTTTGIFIVAAMIFVGIYDAIVVMRNGVACSVSRFLQRVGFKSPIFVLMFGFVLGHLFGYLPPEVTDQDICDALRQKVAGRVSDFSIANPVMIPNQKEAFSVFLVPNGASVKFSEEKPGDDN